MAEAWTAEMTIDDGDGDDDMGLSGKLSEVFFFSSNFLFFCLALLVLMLVRLSVVGALLLWVRLSVPRQGRKELPSSNGRSTPHLPCL